MITLNNKKFAENENEFTDSLFHSGGTCVGYARILKRQVKLFDIKNNHVGTINKNGCLCHHSKLDNGKSWYCFADIKILGDYSFMQQCEDIDKLTVSQTLEGRWFI